MMNEHSPEEKVYFTDVTQAVRYTFIIRLPTYQACHKRPQQAIISTVNSSKQLPNIILLFHTYLKKGCFCESWLALLFQALILCECVSKIRFFIILGFWLIKLWFSSSHNLPITYDLTWSTGPTGLHHKQDLCKQSVIVLINAPFGR